MVELVVVVVLLPEKVLIQKSEDKRAALVAGCEDETKYTQKRKKDI